MMQNISKIEENIILAAEQKPLSVRQEQIHQTVANI